MSLSHTLISSIPPISLSYFFFFFNDTATTEIYTLSLHDALPIYCLCGAGTSGAGWYTTDYQTFCGIRPCFRRKSDSQDRKSTRLNSSHQIISYAVFCLKKKKQGSESQ